MFVLRPEKFLQWSQMKSIVFKHIGKYFIHKTSSGNDVWFLRVKHFEGLDLLASRREN